jgi:hypothetical protein
MGKATVNQTLRETKNASDYACTVVIGMSLKIKVMTHHLRAISLYFLFIINNTLEKS